MNESLNINKDGIHIIKEREKLSLKAYPDNGEYSIGYGHRGPHIKAGMIITEERAEELLKQDLEKFEKEVRRYVKVELNENQFSALVSFSYNVGGGAFSKSTMLKYINQQAFSQAANEFLKWIKSAGKDSPGLIKRREMEKDLFLR